MLRAMFQFLRVTSLFLFCCCALHAAAEEPAPASSSASTETVDPDVLRKVRKLIRGTLSEDNAERDKSWTDIRDMGNLITPGLLEIARDKATPQPMLRSILIALGDSKDPRSGPALLELLASNDVNIRKGAARALGDSGYKSGVIQLEAMGSNPKEDDEVRLFAAASAAKLGSAPALEHLKTLMKSPQPEIRSRAVFALGKFGGIAQVDAVAAALKDADVSVREDAVEALHRIKNRKAQGALIDAISDADFHVRNAAMQALRDTTHQKFENEAKAWQDWWAKHKDDAEPAPQMKIKKFEKNEF